MTTSLYERALRAPLPEQIQAVLEKVDVLGDSLDGPALRKIVDLVNRPSLTRYERWVLQRALRPIYRRMALNHAMGIVLNQPDEMDKFFNRLSSERSAERLQTRVVVKPRDYA